MSVDRELTAEERGVLELVIRHGMTDGRDAALAQLAVARWAGPSHSGDDVCFDIRVPDDVPPITGASSPIGVDVEPHGDVLMGTIDVFIEHGRLASIELSLVRRPDGPNAPWPALDRIRRGLG